MTLWQNPHVVKPDPPRPITASLPERRNEGTDGVLGDGDHPILSRHWPNFPASVSEAERMVA